MRSEKTEPAVNSEFRFHFFIAYSRKDSVFANELYSKLIAEYNVFLDSKSLLLGDLWDEEIPKAHQSSLITLIIISKNTESAFFQREEILSAIEFIRENKRSHRIIPIYLDKIQLNHLPYGLRRINGISVNLRKVDEIIGELTRTLKVIFSNSFTRNSSPSKNDTNAAQILDDVPRQLSVEEIEDANLYWNSPKKKRNRKLKTEFEWFVSDTIKQSRIRKSESYLIYFDINNFSGINKTYGPSVGDKILGIIKKNLKVLCQNHYNSNVSGDEFVVCLLGVDEKFVIDLIKRLQSNIEQENWAAISTFLYVTASFGYAQLDVMSPTRKMEVMNEWIVRAIHGCLLAKKMSTGPGFSRGPDILYRHIEKDWSDYAS